MSFRTFQNGDIGLSIDCWDAETRRRLELIPGLRVDEMEGAARGKVDAVAVAASRLGKKAPSHEFKSGGLVHSLPSMRHYQREGVAKLMSILRAHRGAVLADDMGLGKTLQTIATARSLRADAGRDRVLIVCPAYVRETWVEELAKWAPGETVAVIRPGKAKKQEAEWDKALTAQWVISSYEMAGTVFDAAFARGGPFMLIADEAHMLCGRKAKRSNRLEAIAKQTAFRLALSGTPMWDRPRDFYQLLRIIFGNRFGSSFEFDMAYCGGVFDSMGHFQNKGSSQADELKLRLSYYMVRREKKDVAKDLPPLQRQVIWCDPTEAATLAFHACMADSALATGSRVHAALEETLLAKMPVAIRLAKEARRFLLFTWKRQHAADLHKALCEEDTPNVLVTGDLTTEQRQAQIRQAEANGWGVVATIDSLAAGVNLQGVASVGIMHAIDYVPTKLAQAEARLHRIGQHETVTWYYVAMRESMDVRVVESAVRKLDQWRAVMGEESNRGLRDALGDHVNGAGDAEVLKALFASLPEGV